MRNKIYISLTLMLVLLTTNACDDYLDLRPENGTVREEFWRTKEDIQAAVIGIYSSLLNPPPGRGGLPMSLTLFNHGELRGDMIAPAIRTSNDQQDIMTSNIIPSNGLTDWSNYYMIINLCNTVIDLGPEVLEKDPTLTQQQLNNYLSEALAIRAYMYFTLTRVFRDVPLKLEATLSDTDDFQLPTTPQEEILMQVEADLRLAEQYAVEDYENIEWNKGRITVYAINAMQTDVYLWLEDYQSAVTAANKVIESGNFQLVEPTLSWFNEVYAQGNSSESIFEFQYSLNNLNPFYNPFLQNPEFIAGPGVLEDFFGVDFNDPENKDIRGDRASLVPGTNEIYKFTGLNTDQRKSFQTSDTHWFVYRYPDVLLLKAEALVELDRGEEALEIIEELRENRLAIEQTAENVGANNKNGLIDYILDERGRELAFEGKRWFDLLRNASRNDYARLDILLEAALETAPANQQQTILAKLRDPNSHYLPINENELFTNKELTQNPFYK